MSTTSVTSVIRYRTGASSLFLDIRKVGSGLVGRSGHELEKEEVSLRGVRCPLGICPADHRVRETGAFEVRQTLLESSMRKPLLSIQAQQRTKVEDGCQVVPTLSI